MSRMARLMSGQHTAPSDGVRRAAPLRISDAHDPAEHEADRAADAVMRGNMAHWSLARMTATLHRKCACGGSAAGSGACEECQRSAGSLQRRAEHPGAGGEVPSIVREVLDSPGERLDRTTRSFMESRFRHDFAGVRIHTGPRASESAHAVDALAYTVGRDIVFGAGAYAPSSAAGRRLLAHELAHTLQQQTPSAAVSSDLQVQPAAGAPEHNADAVADAALGARALPAIAPAGGVQRQESPFIRKITVHLTPPQSAELAWHGTPPSGAPGKDSFTVSTGKGYDDPGDDPGTCTRHCCADPMTQCAPPWNQPSRTGACCTYYGNSFWTGTPLDEHNGWKWWTPIQPFYGQRGIALHQHDEVTGQPIGHGCVRMEEPNAKRIHDFSRGQRTNVTIDGRAAPVACDDARKCSASSGAGAARGAGATQGALERPPGSVQTASVEPPGARATPGLEGVMS